MDDMQAEYDLEANRGSMSGLRTMFDFAGIPTDEASIEVATSGIPIYSLLEALSDGRLSELLGEVGQSEPIDFEATLTEYGASPEMAGLGALAAGMAKKRGAGSFIDLFEGLGDIPKKSQELIRDLNQEVNQKTMNEFFDTPEGKTLVRDKRREQQRMIEDYERNEDPDLMASGGRPGLYANIHAKRKRIAAGSGERMRRKGEEGAPTAENFRQAEKTEKKNRGGRPGTRRRRRMMVPASYKTGGQVFQKGYYGKSYK